MKNLKKVVSLTIYTEYLENGANRIVFEMINENDMKRTHKFSYSDTEILTAMFDEDISSKLIMTPKIMTQLLDHIHQQSGEIIICASANYFKLKSYHQDLSDVNLNTNMHK
jgi:hypothetical protein